MVEQYLVVDNIFVVAACTAGKDIAEPRLMVHLQSFATV